MHACMATHIHIAMHNVYVYITFARVHNTYTYIKTHDSELRGQPVRDKRVSYFHVAPL